MWLEAVAVTMTEMSKVSPTYWRGERAQTQLLQRPPSHRGHQPVWSPDLLPPIISRTRRKSRFGRAGGQVWANAHS